MSRIILLIISIIFLSCSSKKDLSGVQGENIEVLESILNKSKGEIYYKTINTDLQKPIHTYIEAYLLEFYLCDKDVDTSSIHISIEEVGFLKRKFENHSIVRIDKLKSGFRSKITKKHKRFKTVSISIPVVFRNGTMAIYYMSGTYWGGFNLLQKRNNKWELICSNSVWIE